MEYTPLVIGLLPEWVMLLKEPLEKAPFSGVRLKDDFGAWCVECSSGDTTFDCLVRCVLAVRVMGFEPTQEHSRLYTVRSY